MEPDEDVMKPRHPRQDELRAHQWIYPFELPDGETVPTIEGGRWDIIHSTRWRMMDPVLDRLFGREYGALTAIDFACNQGYYGLQLARRGCRRVMGVEVRQSLVEQATLMATVMGLEDRFRVLHSDIHDVRPRDHGRVDIVLVLGLLYHLENPIGALRIAHALTGRVCFIETQLAPQLSGPIDWGTYRVMKTMHGCFGIIDETEEGDVPLASTRGISLVPSLEGLVWILRTIGFARVEVLPAPTDGYEQHVSGKRAVIAAFRDD